MEIFMVKEYRDSHPLTFGRLSMAITWVLDEILNNDYFKSLPITKQNNAALEWIQVVGL